MIVSTKNRLTVRKQRNVSERKPFTYALSTIKQIMISTGIEGIDGGLVAIITIGLEIIKIDVFNRDYAIRPVELDPIRIGHTVEATCIGCGNERRTDGPTGRSGIGVDMITVIRNDHTGVFRPIRGQVRRMHVPAIAARRDKA